MKQSIFSNCIVCKSKNIFFEKQIVGYVDGSFYNVIICKNCSTHFVSPHKSVEMVYDLIYKHKKDVPGYSRYNEYANEILKYKNPLLYLQRKEEMYYGAIKSIKKHLKNSGSILDVGCGLGYMTYALAMSGYKVRGIDVSNIAINRAKEKYGDFFFCQDFFSISCKKDKNYYDVICMIELLEHVENPIRYIKHAISLLNPGGVIIITTPNRSWYSKSAIWDNELPPVHLTWFSENGMNILARRVNCSINHFSYFFYNIFKGSLSKPKNCGNGRISIFNKDFSPNFKKQDHSRIYFFTKRLKIYSLLKFVQGIFIRILELVDVVIGRRFLSLSRSNIQCVVLRPIDKNK